MLQPIPFIISPLCTAVFVCVLKTLVLKLLFTKNIYHNERTILLERNIVSLKIKFANKNNPAQLKLSGSLKKIRAPKIILSVVIDKSYIV